VKDGLVVKRFTVEGRCYPIAAEYHFLGNDGMGGFIDVPQRPGIQPEKEKGKAGD